MKPSTAAAVVISFFLIFGYSFYKAHQCETWHAPLIYPTFCETL